MVEIEVTGGAAPQLGNDGGVGRQELGDAEVVVAAQQPAAGRALIQTQHIVALFAPSARRPPQLQPPSASINARGWIRCRAVILTA